MWRKPFQVSAVNASGRVIYDRPYILARDASRRYDTLIRRHPACVVTLWYEVQDGTMILLRWNEGPEYAHQAIIR